MELFEILEKLKKKYATLLIYCLLNRIPILVFGKNSEDINEFLIELSNVIYFRKELVFYTDFISIEEYENLLQIEDMDYNSQKIYIRSPCNVQLKNLIQFNNFDSWLIGILEIEDNSDISLLIKKIENKVNIFLKINLTQRNISIELHGINEKQIELAFEEQVLQKISQDTENSITRMKRVLSEKIKATKVDENSVKFLLDFESEKKELKKSIFRKEIQNFYSASKRAFFILSRMKLMNDTKIKTMISGKTLFETIDYEEIPLSRMISFINKEWKINFSNLIEGGKKAYMGDKIQSLFG